MAPKQHSHGRAKRHAHASPRPSRRRQNHVGRRRRARRPRHRVDVRAGSAKQCRWCPRHVREHPTVRPHRGGGDPVAHGVAGSNRLRPDHAIGISGNEQDPHTHRLKRGVKLVLHVGCTAAARADGASKGRREAGPRPLIRIGPSPRAPRTSLQPAFGLESSTPGSPCRSRSSTTACPKAATAVLRDCVSARMDASEAGEPAAVDLRQ
jgi:hypothetical protein